ncbi:hypothetical protein [Evansella tamaricis]|uniref:Uncharacterized protein n=1 Tax=Evansella tamaricis TaxID=2069301 RepID=A0ABS6JJE6_9BACI|nr:hypothetical protein [Evansella tamaricis]MBU9713658.1 hypothetical protein [Evansella tamaricis]
MRLSDFIYLLNSTNRQLNNFIVFRANTSHDQASFYFRNIPALNKLLTDLQRETNLPRKELEAIFLQELPSCMRQTYEISDQLLSAKMKEFYINQLN